MNKYIDKKYLQLYLDYLIKSGANVENSQWMSLYSSDFNDAKETISFSVIRELKNEFSDITNDPMFPFHLGVYIGENINTNIDYMLKFSSGIGEVVDLSNKFHLVRSNVVFPIYKLLDRSVEIDLVKMQENIEFELPIMFSSAAFINSFFCNSFGIDIGDRLTLNIPDKEPCYFSKIRSQIPFNVRFSQCRSYISVDTEALDIVNPNSDSRLKKLLMRSVIEASGRAKQEATFRVKVRDLLLNSSTLCLNADDVASELHMSKRTMSRRLKEENLTFLAVLDGVRMELAQKYFEHGESVSNVAARLGYESNASLVALFKRHTGQTPKRYRDEL